MKLEDLNMADNAFSFHRDGHRNFSNRNFIVAIRDLTFPDNNLVPILYYQNGNVVGVDSYDMSKILTTNDKYQPNVAPLSERFLPSQLVKISYGNVLSNDQWHEGSFYPRCRTFHTHVNPLNNELVEIFNGNIDEANGRVRIYDAYFHSLISDSYIASKTPFFVETDGRLIGPFCALKDEGEGFFTVEKNDWKPFGEYENNDKTYYSAIVNNVERKFIIPPSNTLTLIAELDFLSNDNVLLEFARRINDSGLDAEKIELTIRALDEISKHPSLETILERNQRVRDEIEKTNKVLESDHELLSLLPQSALIRESIRELEGMKEAIGQTNASLVEKQEELSQELANIERQITEKQELSENAIRAQKEEFEKNSAELYELIDRLATIKDGLEQDITCIHQDLSLQELEDCVQTKQAEVEKLAQEKEELETVLKQLNKENIEAQKDGQKQLVELIKQKKHFDFLSGRELESYDSSPEETAYFKIDYCSNPAHEDYGSFRNLVVELLAKQGRNFPLHFVDNLLISIHQNPLTIFAGLPGTGKTSLARILMQILTPADRRVEIPVHRGWTSQKDLIGFHNPLNNKFHPSSTGMYGLLKQINLETQNYDYLNSPLAYILLDEANLSPLEHYWSTFYNLTDSVAREKSPLQLNLGGSTQIVYPNNIRFVATINYDQTTEPLSPRILDRVNVIQLSQQTQFENNIMFASEEIQHLKLAYVKCIEYFGLFDFKSQSISLSLPSQLESVYTQIKNLLQRIQIFVSPRVEFAIKRYCTVACTVMDDEILALDYAVAQRILPMINVHGASAGETLKILLELFKDYKLAISTEILQKIIRRGEDDSFFEGTFNYFSSLSYAQSL